MDSHGPQPAAKWFGSTHAARRGNQAARRAVGSYSIDGRPISAANRMPSAVSRRSLPLRRHIAQTYPHKGDSNIERHTNYKIGLRRTSDMLRRNRTARPGGSVVQISPETRGGRGALCAHHFTQRARTHSQTTTKTKLQILLGRPTPEFISTNFLTA